MLNIKKYIYDRQNKKYVSKLKKNVKNIRNYITEYERLSDEMLVHCFYEVVKEVNKEMRMEKCFAIGTVAIERIKGLKLYDVQLQGAITLYEGKIAEMKTGEGKTITSVLPALLRSMTGQVHICTVNKYLAQRDKEAMEPIYNFFGRSVALNLQEDTRGLKKEHYKADIVYSTGSTLGFDYLYDNMVQKYEDKCCSDKDRYFALIDEVDLILIDEARTPLIIGAPFKVDNEKIKFVDTVVKSITPDDYKVDREHQAVFLTESGENVLAERLGVDSLFTEENINLLHLVHQSLMANYYYRKDIDYTIINHKGENRVVIIDTYTGRIQPDRRFSNGLHQALEAKHSDECEIKDETKTTATITLQNFFRLYDNLAGMSGTAHEEREEFAQVYNLQVVEIETNKPSQREDKTPSMEITKDEKWQSILNKVKEYHNLGYPILIGTASVEDSEAFSRILIANKLEHTVLNAKQDKSEAEVISKAGRKNAITIATNMAGRGTDILTESEDHPLVVIVTELNESSRIDNQLKGRTSRQGAKGITETILSAEDSIFDRSTLSDKLKKIRQGTDASSKLIHILTTTVQTELEGANTESRKQALKYDDIIREQRTLFYKSRDKVLLTNDVDDLESILRTVKLDEDRVSELRDRGLFKEAELLQHFILYSMDKAWVEHIDRLDSLKNAIGWRGQSGHNPFIIYQNEAQKLYDELPNKIKNTMVETLDEMIKSEIRLANAYDGDKKKELK